MKMDNGHEAQYLIALVLTLTRIIECIRFAGGHPKVPLRVDKAVRDCEG